MRYARDKRTIIHFVIDTSSQIIIIYNPNSSSGKAEIRAQRLYRQLLRRKYVHVTLKKTEYQNHAERIAYELTRKYKDPLLISVSGDGGYNEVINGAMLAYNESRGNRKPICALLAAGNANDHRKAVAKRSLLRAIVDGKPEAVDILCLRFLKTQRYAHSYIGVGPTAEIGAELNREKLTRWKEIKIVTRNLINFRHFTILDRGRWRELDSLVFANIHRMSKVFKLNTETDLHDGLFNLFIIPKRTRFKFLFLLVKLIVFGAKNPPQLPLYSFKLKHPQLGHLDGEVMALPAQTDISVTVEKEFLLTLR